ncbi:hypothetical protein AHAS_Ahas09G0144100 [Arachis hypogaea]
MEYCSPLQYYSSHYSNDGWEYHQEMTEYEQSNQWGYAPEPQNDQDTFMGYYLTAQNDSLVPGNINKSVNNQMKWDTSQSHKMTHIAITTTHMVTGKKIRRKLELLSKKHEDQSMGAKKEVEEQGKEAPIPNETSMEKEVVEIFEPVAPYSQKLIEVIEEHETSPPKDSTKYHVEEGKEANQGCSHSIEAESYMDEGLIEPPIQEAFGEENTLTITQLPSHGIKKVKATDKSTKERIVTKL